MHNLDLLRSIAVMLVLLCHTAIWLGHPLLGEWITGHIGVFGVFLFFIHTSLVLMWSLERQPNVLSFYVRRIFRIYPLAIFLIFCSLALGVNMSQGGINLTPQHFAIHAIVANLLLIQNLFFQPNIVGVMWTLTIEVQMYILLPVLFVFAHKERRIWPLVLLWAFTVLIDHTYFQPSVGNVLPTVIPDFLPGVIAYVAFMKFKPVLPSWTFAPFILLMLALYMHAPSTAWSWPLALCIGLALPFFRQIKQRTLVSISHNVAKYSYGIYLWHEFGIKLSFHLLQSFGGVTKVSVELLITAAASILGFHFIEEPMIRLGNKFATAIQGKPATTEVTVF
jgi:peptidoglycan/LPS O-acetylase OafA/YrhL